MTRWIQGNSVSWTDVNAINQRMDNPTFQDRVFSDMMQKYFPQARIPLLAQEGHRRYNHDGMSAVRIAMEKGNKMGFTKALETLLLHNMQDSISNQLRDNVGTEGRDIIEALLNFSFSRHRRHTGLRRMYS
jgi:hypothetical protein